VHYGTIKFRSNLTVQAAINATQGFVSPQLVASEATAPLISPPDDNALRKMRKFGRVDISDQSAPAKKKGRPKRGGRLKGTRSGR
jgi:hypothetical protein